VTAVISVLGALALVAALVLLLWRFQERVVFQPTGPPYPSGGAAAERVTYRADDGHELFALVVLPPRDRPPRGVLLAFHGNADLAAWRVPWARELARRAGWMVVLPEYRGYAGLAGPPTAEGVRRDARAAAALARTVAREGAGADRPPLPIALHGHSLGSAVAAELATEVPEVRALVLESPFTSAREMARRLLAPAVLFWGAISRIPYDTRARVAALDVPVSVAHGEADGIIPARMGRQVFEAARVRGALLLVRDADHNDLVEVGGERYWEWLEKALDVRDEGRGTRDE
jgi:alpha-beta hydrolase superfamily lysophospholipase